MKQPLFSVIIPTYNCAFKIQRSIQSVLSQSYSNFEILVMDDGSTDETKDIVLSFDDSRITYFWDKNFGGPARPRNRGIECAKGDWICFLDADDWWDFRKLELSLIEIETGADVIYHDLYYVRSLNQSVFRDRLRSSTPRSPMFRSLLCRSISIPNSSVVVRKDLLKEIGGISENKDLVSVEDYDTWIRLSKITENFVRISKPLGYYWVGGGNISAASPVQCFRIDQLYKQYFHELSMSEQKKAKAFLAYRIGRIAMLYGDRDKSKKYLLMALAGKVPITYRIKSLFFYLSILLK